MAVERKALDPQIIIKDKIVSVGPLDWKGVKDFLAAVSSANLPLPDLATGSVHSWIESAKVDPSLTTIGLYQVIVDLVSENMQVIYQWIINHPPIVSALVRGATGLEQEELDSLSAGTFVRVVRASWKALVDDGFFSEVGSFFVESLPLSLNQAGAMVSEQGQVSQTLPASGESSAATSKSESASPPAGP